jgi:hypothetical protein
VCVPVAASPAALCSNFPPCSSSQSSQNHRRSRHPPLSWTTAPEPPPSHLKRWWAPPWPPLPLCALNFSIVDVCDVFPFAPTTFSPLSMAGAP